MPHDFYRDFPTKSFKTTLTEVSDALNQIGNGKQAGEEYNAIVQRLWVFAKRPQLTSFGFETHRQVRYAVAALVQERGEMGCRDKDLLSSLIGKSRFKALLDGLLVFQQEGFDVNAAQARLCPALLHLYYQRYFSFEAGIADNAVRTALLEPLKRMLRHYDGRNRMTLLARSNTPLLEGHLDKVLLGFDNLKPLNEIRATLILSDSHEIFQRLRLMRLLTNIRALHANKYDAHVKQLFVNVKQYPHVWANSQRLILEECVREMLLKCQKLNEVCEDWQQFIFETIGDPRASKNTQAWQRVGAELHVWYRGILSRGDLREFLETMTDGQGDTIYQYRKQFWLQYVNYAVNAKIMLGSRALERLHKQSPDIYQRFVSSPETYSQLNETERSCVFIDFGSFCVIEATHSGKWRVYKSAPLKLTDSWYDYEEFHSENAKLLLIGENRHFYPAEYSWQNNVRVLLNDWIAPPLALEAVLLDADKTPKRIAQIRNYLLRNNQNPN